MSEAGSSEVSRRKLFDEDSMFDSSEGFMEEEATEKTHMIRRFLVL